MSFFEEEEGEEEELDINGLDWKIKVELPVPNLDTPIEKAASAIKLHQAGLISHEKALKMIDMEDEIERMRLAAAAARKTA